MDTIIYVVLSLLDAIGTFLLGRDPWEEINQTWDEIESIEAAIQAHEQWMAEQDGARRAGIW